MSDQHKRVTVRVEEQALSNSLTLTTRVVVENGIVDGGRRGTGESLATCRHLIEHRAEAEAVRSGVQLLAQCLLRGYVSDGELLRQTGETKLEAGQPAPKTRRHER